MRNVPGPSAATSDLLQLEKESSSLRVHVIGCFAVFARHDGTNLTPRGRKARALLAYLISNGGSKVPKASVMELLWGDREEAQARSSLRQTLRELRASINTSHEILCSDREHIWVPLDKVVEGAADDASRLKEAFEDLAGISPEFDDWLAVERSRRSKHQIATLKAHAEDLLRNGYGDEALALVEEMQVIDPYDEDALDLALAAEFELGHPGAIAERYRATAALLSAGLGVQPSDETRQLRDRLIARLTDRQQQEPLPQSDQEYFTRRAREEREAAARAQTDVSRKIHAALSDRYERVVMPPIGGNREFQISDEHRTTLGNGQFRRRSLVIRALQWFKPGDHCAVLGGSAGDADCYVDTPAGRLRVDPGDWIITGISGENYPCKPDIFEQLYTASFSWAGDW